MCTRKKVGNNTDADWLIVVAHRPDLCECSNIYE